MLPCQNSEEWRGLGNSSQCPCCRGELPRPLRRSFLALRLRRDAVMRREIVNVSNSSDCLGGRFNIFVLTSFFFLQMMLNMRRLWQVALQYGFADLEAELRASTMYRMSLSVLTPSEYFSFFCTSFVQRSRRLRAPISVSVNLN